MKERGLGRIYRRKLSKCWWIQFSHRGKVHRQSSGSENRGNAVRLLRQKLAEIGSGRFQSRDSEKVTFEDLEKMLVDDVTIRTKPRTVEVAHRTLKHLRRFFGGQLAIDIKKDIINAYVRQRLEEEEAARATVRLEIAFLKWAFSVAIEAGKLDKKPIFPEIRVDNARKGFFEPQDLEAVKRHLPEHLRGVVEFLYLSAWRVGEVLPRKVMMAGTGQEQTVIEGGLRWHQVDFQAGVARLDASDSKNSEGRILPFAYFPQLRDLLLRQREYTDQVERKLGVVVPWVFHRDGKSLRVDFRFHWKRACMKAGLPGRVVHDLRRSGVRNLVRAGVPETIAMRLTGHRTRSVFARYDICSDRDLQEAVQRLSTFHQVHQVPAPAPALPRTGTVRAQFGA